MLDNLGNLQRTHSCGELRANNIGKTVTLMGWVAKRRDFGELTFVDLRDRDGITQVVFNSQDAAEAHTKAKDLRGEFVIAVSGEVVSRAENTRNPRIATGASKRCLPVRAVAAWAAEVGGSLPATEVDGACPGR